MKSESRKAENFTQTEDSFRPIGENKKREDLSSNKQHSIVGITSD